MSTPLYEGNVTYQGKTVPLQASASGVTVLWPAQTLFLPWSSVLGAVEEPGLTVPVFSLLTYHLSRFQRLTFLTPDAQTWVSHLQSLMLRSRLCAANEPPPRSRYLVLINPASGSGKALSQWNRVYPFFEGCVLDIVLTEYAQHGDEIVQKYALDEIQAILVVSGDGLMHEVINGLGKRKDWEIARKTPVFLIPGGSGNAFSTTVLHESKLPHSLENCAYLAIKGVPRPLDLIKVTYESGFTAYAFLSVTWGYIADVDRESEFLRIFGGWRFYIYGVYRLLRLKRYQGTVTFTDLSGNTYNQPDEYTYFVASNMPYLSDSAYLAPRSHSNDGCIDLLMINTRESGRFGLAQVLLTEDNGNHLDYPQLHYHKTTEFTLNPVGRNSRILLDGEVGTT